MTTKQKTYNVHEAKTNLSRLLQQVAAGEEVVIARAGQPVAKLVPMPKRKKPEMGFAKGQIWIADDFDAPLPPDLRKYFE